MAIATGPAIRVVCRVLNQNSCGSGSIVGNQPDGRALILTNAHVAGTQIGRIVIVEVESQGNERLQARVIMAGYSNQTSSDWALLETVNPYQKVKPVKLSKSRPTGSHYTKGFPRCQPFAGTDITTVRITQYVWFWEPDAIGGQSGSGVWSDEVERQEGLLTWQWGDNGAGQPTSAIYGEMSTGQLMGAPLPPGARELPGDYDFAGIDRSGLTDPIVEAGIFAEMGIRDLPIWWEPAGPIDPPLPPPTGGEVKRLIELQIASERALEEQHRKNRQALESMIETQGIGFSADVDTTGIFGL